MRRETGKGGILGLIKSAAMEFGEHNITVDALIPGLVDTALTRYDKRLSETIGETGRPKDDHPSPQKAWDIRAPTVPLKVGWLQPDDISPAALAWWNMAFRGVTSGFLIAAMVWMIPSAENAKFVVITLMTYLIAIGGFTHIVAGSMEAYMLALSGEWGW